MHTHGEVSDSHRAVFARWWGFTLFVQTVSSWWWLVLIGRGGGELMAAAELSVGIAGLLLFFSPQRVALLPVAAVLHLLNLGLLMPEVPNHRLLTGAINVAILCLGTHTADFPKRWEEFCSTVRSVLVATYAFAVIHKLNSDFLFSPLSCGRVYTSDTLAFLGIPQSAALLAASPWLTIGIEGAVALLLANRKLSWFGATLALAFHAVLVLHPTKHFIDFTCVIFGAVILTFPIKTSKEPFADTLGRFALSCGVALVIAFQILGVVFSLIPAAYFALWVLFLFMTAWLIRTLPRPAPYLARMFPASISGQLLVLAVIFNGMTPYLGIKNKVSWDMYSNLRLEERVSNHLIFPPSLDLSGEMTELTQIVSSNIPSLESLRLAGMRVPRLELDRLVRNSNAPQVQFIWRRQEWSITPENISPDGYRASFLKRKLFWFRPMVAPGDPVPCGR